MVSATLYTVCDARKHIDECLLPSPRSGKVSWGKMMPEMKFEECIATKQVVKKIGGGDITRAIALREIRMKTR